MFPIPDTKGVWNYKSHWSLEVMNKPGGRLEHDPAGPADGKPTDVNRGIRKGIKVMPGEPLAAKHLFKWFWLFQLDDF